MRVCSLPAALLVSSLFPLSFSSLASHLAAQSYVSPATHVRSEGAGTQSFPFGISTVPFRYLQIHDDVPAMLVNGIAFRHNAGGNNNSVFPAHSVTLDAWVSTAATTSATPSSTYDSNHGTDKARVATNRTYNLPASDPTDLPGAFILDYPFDTAFPYAGGGLCWEVQITAKTQTTSIFYDAMLAANSNPPMAVSRGGDGCLATGATMPMDILVLGPLDWTTGSGTLNLTGNRLLANGSVVLVFGLDKTSWAGQSLPLVIPTSTGAPSGTCTIYENILVTVPGTANGSGSWAIPIAFTLPIPTLMALNGLTTYAQVMGLDAQANPFGLTASKMGMHNIVAPFPAAPIARVYRSGDIANPVGSTVQNTNTLITRFD